MHGYKWSGSAFYFLISQAAGRSWGLPNGAEGDDDSAMGLPHVQDFSRNFRNIISFNLYNNLMKGLCHIHVTAMRLRLRGVKQPAEVYTAPKGQHYQYVIHLVPENYIPTHKTVVLTLHFINTLSEMEVNAQSRI